MSPVQHRSQMVRLLLITAALYILPDLLPAVMADTSVALWQDNKQAAVSMTFDDGLLSQYNNAFPKLEKEGLKGTFFIISGSYDENMVLALAKDCQEIGSHSDTYESLVPLSPEEQDQKMRESQLDLQTLTGKEVSTFAYPYGEYDPNVIIAADDYYIAARTAYPFALNDPLLSSNPNWFYKLKVVDPFGPEGNADPNIYLNNKVAQAIEENKWAIEMFHSIDYPGGWHNISTEIFRAHVDYLRANEPGNIWVAPVGTVSEYIYERNTALINETLYLDDGLIQLDLSCGLDDRFNTPLTLLTDCPPGWETGIVYVRQGPTVQIAEIISGEISDYIMYDALPDAEMIQLSTTPPMLTVTAEASENGTITPPGSITIPWGSDQTFTAMADPNYQVDQWYIDGVPIQSGGNNYTISQIHADQNIFVTFKPYTATVALWQNDKKAAVSITFDDGLRSQFKNAFPILREHDLKATFFFVLNYLGYPAYMDDPNVIELAQNGQEIGSHSLSHGHLITMTEPDLIKELSDSQGAILDRFGQDAVTIAYPFGEYDPNVIAVTDDYYIAARTALLGALNDPSQSSDPNYPNWFYELKTISPYGVYGNDDPNIYLRAKVELAIAENKWDIEMFHSIDYPGGWENIPTETFRAHMNYLANEPNVWVAPMGTVVEYIYERNAASIILLYSDSSLIRLDLGCPDLETDSRFDTPLTLLSPCPIGWESREILVKQGQKEESVQVVSKNGDLCMMYNALPGAGMIELFPASYTITASAGANGAIDPNGVVSVDYGLDQPFTAMPDTGYEVDSWSVDGAVVQSGGTEYTLANIMADQTVSVIFKKIQFTISGQILNPAGASLPGVMLTADNGGGQALADSNGYYELFVDYGWSGIVEPNAVGYVFDPNIPNYVNVASDMTGDYAGRHIADLVPDGFIDGSDLQVLCENWLVSLDLDIYNDGQMNLKDFSILAEHWQQEYGNYDLVQHTIVTSSGSGGIIDPFGTLIVDHMASQLFTATPDTGYEVYSWSVDGAVVQNGVTEYMLANIRANQAVSVTFKHIADLVPDGVIDGDDLQILGENWLANVSADLDIYVDGEMNLKDFSILAEHWLEEY